MFRIRRRSLFKFCMILNEVFGLLALYNYCMVDEEHFLCDPRLDPSLDSHCLEAAMHPSTDEERNGILKILNKLREDVASGNKSRREVNLPPSADMLQLDWYEELESASANIVRRSCIKKSTNDGFPFCCGCNIIDRFETNVVQHSFVVSQSNVNYTDWELYFKYLDVENSVDFQISDICLRNWSHSFLLKDHYLLLIRAEISLVGCSSLVATEASGNSIHYFACVFGGGFTKNWTGAPVYLEGRPCSKCPPSSKCSETYHSLCSKKCHTGSCLTSPADEANSSNCPGAHEVLTNAKSRLTNDQYCSLNEHHMLCGGTAHYSDQCPSKKDIFPQTNADIQIILKVFNSYRNKIADGNETLIEDYNVTLPSASDMLELNWDEELAEAARNLADSCRIQNFDFCCNCHHTFDGLGTNLFQFQLISDTISSYHWPSWDHFLDILKQNYSQDYILQISNITNHFYTKSRFELLARSELSRIGCSVAMYSRGNDFIHHPVCIFGGLTGWKGTAIYRVGEPCTNCPIGSTCSASYPSLCKCLSKQCHASTKSAFTWKAANYSRGSQFNLSTIGSHPRTMSEKLNVSFINPEGLFDKDSLKVYYTDDFEGFSFDYGSEDEKSQDNVLENVIKTNTSRSSKSNTLGCQLVHPCYNTVTFTSIIFICRSAVDNPNTY